MNKKKHEAEAEAQGIELKGASRRGAKYRIYTCKGCASPLDLRTDNVRKGQFTCKGCGPVVPGNEQATREVTVVFAEVQAPGESKLLTVIYPNSTILASAPEGTVLRKVTALNIDRQDLAEIRRFEKSAWVRELAETSIGCRCYPSSLRSLILDALDAFSVQK